MPQVLTAAPIQAEAFSHGKPLGLIELVAIGGGHFLRSDAALAWQKVRQKAEEARLTLKVDSAFRFMPEQEQLWQQHQQGLLETPVARPGHSNHQSGIALDIAVHRSDHSPEYVWLALNAPGFGWHNVGAIFHPPEFWHWEFTPPGGSNG